MSLFKKTYHPLLVEDEQYDWGGKSRAGRKFLFTSCMVLAAVGFVTFVIPV